MTPKQYYKTYQADDSLSEMSEQLLTLIHQSESVHALEFGCGSGKHLKRLRAKGMSCMGLDISVMNCMKAIMDNEGIIYADETYLRHLVNFDCLFTVSVMDHIEEVELIINEFKRIANNVVFLAETQIHNPKKFYWNHDYEALGFTDLGLEFEMSEGDGNIYKIWRWRKGEDLQAFVAHDDLR